MWSKGYIVWSGLTIGNFLYAWFVGKSFEEPTKISFFQAVAISVYIYCSTK